MTFDRYHSLYWTHARTLAARDGGYVCRYCGAALIPPVGVPGLLPNPDAVRGSVDHLTPAARGGGENVGNLGLACMPCNKDKGNLNEIEYRRLLKGRAS
jgi:5-methylcytosine-specific restriction endonuclease McrA